MRVGFLMLLVALVIAACVRGEPNVSQPEQPSVVVPPPAQQAPEVPPPSR